MPNKINPAAVGLTVPEAARFLRVSPDKVRGWIKRGELRAINTAAVRCGRPRYVILPHHLAEWEKSHDVAGQVETQRPRKKRQFGWQDFYPD
jgi:excisionase family DNA binding protein